MFKPVAASGPVTLNTNLADYAISKALKSGEVSSDLVKFEFNGTKIANQSFKPYVREGKFDASELAIVTLLQALAWGKPIVMLPAVMVGRFQHNCISYDCRKGDLTPKQIEGKRVGVRAYTQTTGAWVRGLLGDEYGVDINKVHWYTYEDPHVAEYKEPDFLSRFEPNGKTMEELMFEGLFDAVIIGGEIPNEPRAKTLIPNAKQAAVEWHKKTGAVTVNHFFTVSNEVAKRPELVAEIWRMLKQSKAAMPTPADGIDVHPFGWEENRKNLELIIQYSYEQKLIPRMMNVEELITPATRDLKL